jgi:methylated-DNA-protein-cysteine methyltransferase-like protein
MNEKTFTDKVVRLIKNIPGGKVATYGQIATMAGDPYGARQVVRILHTLSGKENLPWHRVINSKGTISLTGQGYLEQRALLEGEGVRFNADSKIDFDSFLWKP